MPLPTSSPLRVPHQRSAAVLRDRRNIAANQRLFIWVSIHRDTCLGFRYQAASLFRAVANSLFCKSMAFWGLEVKSGKPISHKFDDLKGRLHISMATLGSGSASSKSILQCNVGNRSPVYLCSLYPGSSESLQLNLEFEEVDEVIFSVIGPRSIHLCGYYLGCGRNTNLNEESESYGEDIRDTETERSGDDEDDYEDSFIDDSDPEVLPPSPISTEEKDSHHKRTKDREGSCRRLRRKYQLVESDDEGYLEEKIIANNNIHDQTKENHNEDSLPISSLYKSKTAGRVLDQEMDEGDDRGVDNDSNKNGEDGDNELAHHQTHRGGEQLENLPEPCTVQGVDNVQKLKKKKKEKRKEVKNFEAEGACNGQSIKLDNGMQDEPTMDEIVQDLPIINGQSQEQVNVRKTQTMDKLDPSSEIGHEQGEKPKKKRKERPKEVITLVASGVDDINHVEKDKAQQDEIKAEQSQEHIIESQEKTGKRKRKKKQQMDEGSHCEVDNAGGEVVIKESKVQRDETESDNVIHGFPEGKEQGQKLNNEEGVYHGAQDFPDENQSEYIKVKKRKKKSKSQGDVKVVTSDSAQLPVDRNSGPLEEDGNKMADKSSQVRTLSNGLVITELERGTEDGKIATLGRKISVHYIGKLKENGEVFESNVDHAPFKFRLGKGEVMKGWDLGLEGMQVGEKRRLIIPPSLGFGNDGYGENIPPNSWLVYDLKLVKVH
ncbi:hypothetical protein L6164_017244 [Bauhinia variegata]|uniref:Uncharacterized protein n=1 Tax=Bauhinia variegata TaxID=167791 RepID=A0ACB9N752_BAUVA|nr:hypothetical protein L6164_017244 [Bauhinia variegata]